MNGTAGISKKRIIYLVTDEFAENKGPRVFRLIVNVNDFNSVAG